MTTSIDANGVPAIFAILNTNGTGQVSIVADPVTHILGVSDAATGTDSGPTVAAHDGNMKTSIMAVSNQTITVNGVNYIQGVTPVVLYANASGKLLTDSS